MAGIYTDQHDELGTLLTKASNDEGASLLIPNLQRPFEWSPLQDKEPDISTWMKALSLTLPILDPVEASLDDVVTGIEARDTIIRKDLVEFIKGTKSRVDVAP